MPTVDDRVVAMSFENNKFESGVSKTMSTLDKLKAALKFDKTGKGLSDIESAANRMNFSHMASAIDGLKGKFSALRLIGIQVLGNIASQAVSAGARFAKSLTLGPIISGFQEYSTNLNSIQTILANTSDSGGNLKTVNAALNDLNRYSDKTIYNFSQMARNIGTFTAAGVRLKPAVSAIKGIANLAALSGSNSQQASTAMYQLSQAIAAGRVGLQDWNSVVNAGMGGAVFQKSLMRTAENMGAIEKGAVKIDKATGKATINGKTFRESIMAKPGEQSWLTSDVLTKTLSQFTGDLSNAQLAAQGFSQEEIKAIQNQAKMAQAAATEVKTLPQVFDVARETIGSGWAKTFQTIFGDFGESKKTFTALSNTINGFINTNANARNKILGDWKKLGGRTVLIDAIKSGFGSLSSVLGTVKDAFRDIFPPKTGKDLYDFTLRFKQLVDNLRPSAATLDNLKSTFRGFFAILDIGKQVVSGVFSVIGRLFGKIGQGSGGFLAAAGNVGDFLTSLDRTLQKSNAIGKFFDKISAALEVPIASLGRLKDGFVGLFSGVNGSGISDFLHGMASQLKPAMNEILDVFRNMGQAIATALQGSDFSGVMEVLQVGLLGGIFVTIRKFFKKSLGDSLFGGIKSSITGTMDALTGKMQAMQQNVKADTLMKIAIAIGILTASVVALSLVNSANLNKALTAMAVGFGQLLGAMAILTNVSKSAGFLKVPFIAAAMILLAGAIGVLTLSVAALSRLSWEELTKGLAGVAVLLAAVSAASIPLSANSGGMIRAGLGITAIAVAMKILASAVKDFGSMSWTDIGKGLAAVAAALVAIGLASKLFPSGMVSIGVGLIAVSAGLKLLAGAVAVFGGMNWQVIGKGILSIAAAMLVIAGALRLMPPNMLSTSAGILLVAVALKIIGKSVESLGGMSMEQLAKGLGALAAELLILGAALYFMIGTLPGAAALAVAAGSLALITPSLEKLGSMSWGSIIKGLVALGAALAVLGVAGVLLAPVAPAMLAMGAALLLIGGALALAGAGIFLIGTGLSAIAVAGPAAIAILIASLIKFAEAIPRVATAFALGFLAIVDKISEVAPKFVAALAKILVLLADTVIASAPKLALAFVALIQAALNALRAVFPNVLATGIDILKNLLKGIVSNIGSIVTLATTIIVKFVTSIANNLGRIIQAGGNLVVKFIAGISNYYGRIITAGTTMIVKLISGISNAIGKIITTVGSLITKFLGAIATAGSRIITAGTSMIIKLVTGISSAASRVVSKGLEVAGKFVTSVAKGLVKLADTGASAIIDFLNGIAGVIRNREPELIAAGVNIGKAIVGGFITGLGSIDIIGAVERKFAGAIDAAKRKLHIKSPSAIFADMGKNVVLGFAIGVASTNDATRAMEAMSNGIINSVKSIFQITSPSRVMRQLGQYVGGGFALGLLGSGDQITSAFNTLQGKLTEAMQTARDTIKTEEDKLDRLRDAKKKDFKAIQAAQAEIKENQDLLDRATAAHRVMVKELKDEEKTLVGLSKDYQKVSDKLDVATRALEDAKKARDDAFAGFSDKYGELPEIDTGVEQKDPLGTYITGLQNRTVAVAQYQSTLEQLRSLGLDDKTYQKLLDEGTADQQFATQLLSGGKTAVAALNVLDGQLASVSRTLASQASQHLYQAGVDSAQGIVNGLKSQLGEITKAMETIATAMIKAIRKKLKIKSPSQEFAEIGKLVNRGTAQGITSSSKVVTNATVGVAEDALTAMRRSISDVVMSDMNVSPVITPVLDLSMVQKDSQKLRDLTDVASSSFGQASAISAASQSAGTAAEEQASKPSPSINLTQNNYSPEALSQIEIYRQTRNQISQLRGVLVPA